MNIVEEIAGKAITIADNQQKVFDAGKTKEWSDFWDAFQNYGDPNGTICPYAFAYGRFTDANFNPKYPIYIQQGTTTADYMFYNSQDITGINVPIYCKCARLSNTFNNCQKLKTISYLELLATTTFSAAFNQCYALENITIGGTIGQNGLSFNNSYKLSHDSLISVINALEVKTSGTWTLTLGETNLAKLTDVEKAIATQKGWTLA